MYIYTDRAFSSNLFSKSIHTHIHTHTQQTLTYLKFKGKKYEYKYSNRKLVHWLNAQEDGKFFEASNQRSLTKKKKKEIN